MKEIARQMTQAFARHQVACDIKILPIDATGASVQIGE